MGGAKPLEFGYQWRRRCVVFAQSLPESIQLGGRSHGLKCIASREACLGLLCNGLSLQRFARSCRANDDGYGLLRRSSGESRRDGQTLLRIARVAETRVGRERLRGEQAKVAKLAHTAAPAYDECQLVSPSPRRRIPADPRSMRREAWSTADHRGQSLGLDSPPSICGLDSTVHPRGGLAIVHSRGGLAIVHSRGGLAIVQSRVDSRSGRPRVDLRSDGLGWTYGPTASGGLTVRRPRVDSKLEGLGRKSSTPQALLTL